MQSKLGSIPEYLDSLPEDRKKIVTTIHEAIVNALPKGFESCMNYGMIGYVVPHSIYPSGYHCDPKLPLPFMGLASQKNNISLYHMGIYADQKLMDWFTSEYAKRVKGKLDMGKSCIRFKKLDAIPVDLISELSAKLKAEDWITIYETNIKR